MGCNNIVIRLSSFVLFYYFFCLSDPYTIYAKSTDVAPGDGTCLGMVVETITPLDSGYKVVTTGAVFRIDDNGLCINQNLSVFRELAIIQWPASTNFILIEQDRDHVVFHGEGLIISLYGDSTCVIRSGQAVQLRIQGLFNPEYIGRYFGELLLIDQAGGLEVYTDQNREGYPFEFSGVTKDGWYGAYHMKKDERLMLAAFPARPFDWKKSFSTNIVFTQAARGRHYGEMPPDWLIRKWSQYFQIILLWHNGLYTPTDAKATYAGPYEIANPVELHRAVSMAHQVGLKIVLYTSFYYFYKKFHSTEAYFRQIQNLKEAYQIDGVYIDGLLTGTCGHQKDQMFTNWYVVRRLRAFFGCDGVIVYHGTAFGHSVATMPHVDTYCDATINGENVPFESFDDPYIQYHVRKYGISNTIALWKPGPGPFSVEDEGAVVDAILNMHGRIRYWAGVIQDEPTVKQQQIWRSDISENYRNYLRKLLSLKRIRSSAIYTEPSKSATKDMSSDHSIQGIGLQ